ncbi:MAG: aromatic ring-hydroxylating dioxygenase subunit alpha [Deltaproteobacteria bacterium]|nr:MAG: aromatic ring-hydroxylating dioxygenase subunit alpha [Deltaproteobacteria bacterium]
MPDVPTKASCPPPSFDEAKNRRQRARAAGMDPNYWYAVGRSADLRKGQVMATRFWGQDIAVFRGEDGRLRAVEDRCAHRHIKLSTGEVVGCRLVCPYHGWEHDGDGNVKIPHDLFGRPEPRLRIRSVPVKERYGLVFIFPGDPQLATVRDVPTIPELEGDDPWPHAIVQFDCEGHFSMLLENVSDFTHGFLHRKYQPFYGQDLLRLDVHEDRVEVEYATKVAAGRLQDAFVRRLPTDRNRMVACYDYPYHWSNTDDRIKHFLFTLPKDERSNRHIFIFYLHPDGMKLPGVPGRLPRPVLKAMMAFARKFTLEPLLGQDVWVIGHEQEGWDAHHDKPAPELSPVVKAFQDLTIRKWREHLERTGGSDLVRVRPCRPSSGAEAGT